MLVKISDIKVKRRVRKDLGNLDALKDSLRTYGLFNPITLDSKNVLIAGERRLEAAKAIGWETINAIVINKTLDKVSQLEMEMEENNQRKEFTDEELLEGYHRLEKLKHPSLIVRFLRWLGELFTKLADFIKRLFTGKA
ncbi:MAG: ParB N-terminal domain-containing protein [Treponema sp.]|nr:ParB N-terminal domain-containing protein [Treponema sp.]